jgi:uncharacterized protein YjbI with pentapeptide repeats
MAVEYDGIAIFGGLMATKGGGSDDGPAHGWDLLKWKWIAEPPTSLAAPVLGFFLLIGFFILASGLFALWQLLAPIWTGASLVPSPAATDTGAELRGRILIIGALVAAPFGIWRLVVGHWSARAAQEQARIAQETARNTLFTKAIEQLGATREQKRTVPTLKKFALALETIAGESGFHDETNTVPNTEVRLGAIYALEKLARDDLEMHWPIMETLCAYIRENAGKPRTPPTNMLATLAEHWRNRLSDKVYEEFKRVAGRPSVDVQAAIAVIGRRTETQREYERSRREEKTSRTTDAWRLDLSDCYLASANFVGLDFTAARFSGSSLYLSNFSQATLTGAVFRNAHLEGANFHFAHAGNADFSKAHLDGARLTKAHINGAFLNEASLRGAWLNEAHLESTLLGDARLDEALLDKAHLEGAWLNGTSLSGASLRDTQLVDVLMDKAFLGKAETVAQTQIEAAWGDEDATLPEGFTRLATNDGYLKGLIRTS